MSFAARKPSVGYPLSEQQLRALGGTDGKLLDILKLYATRSYVHHFDDFDGERIECTTMIEEREWLRGAKWTEWLSLFYPPKVRRSLELEFSKETGSRKGSWKGGTMGHSIDLEPGELHESGFRRYCAKNGMTFVGEAVHA